MKKKFGLLIVMLFVLFSGITNLTAQTKKVQEQSALLYEISGNGLKTPSYIFGTIHIICPNDMISTDKFDKYLDATERIIMEIDLDDQAEMSSMGKALYLPEGKTLADYLTAEQYAKVGELVKDTLGTPIENVKNIHPLFLSVMINTTPKAMGCSPAGSYELTFLQTAVAKKKPIDGLETVAFQIEKVNSNFLEKQAVELYKMALDPKKSFDEFKFMIEAYKAQNSDEIYKVTQKYFAADPNFEANLLTKRNADWIPKIEKAVKEKPSFIAVGAGHLGGKTGVLSLLREKGYKLKPIRL